MKRLLISLGVVLVLAGAGRAASFDYSIMTSTVSASGTNAQNVKPSAGLVTGWSITNLSFTGARTVHFFDKSTAPAAGTDTPKFNITVTTTTPYNSYNDTNGIYFANGIGITITGKQNPTDATVVSSSDVVVNIFYR